MTTREQVLRRQLDDADKRIVALEQRVPAVEVMIATPAPRNALQSMSDWWHGGSTAGARSRHMRVNY